MISGQFNVPDYTKIVFQNNVQIQLALAIRRKCGVMAINQKDGARGEAGRHGEGFSGVEPDQDKALPGGTMGGSVGAELAQKGLFELEDLFDVHGGDKGLGCGNREVRQYDVVELIGTGGKDGSALVDFGGIKEVEDGKMLNLQDFIHALKT